MVFVDVMAGVPVMICVLLLEILERSMALPLVAMPLSGYFKVTFLASLPLAAYYASFFFFPDLHSR
jgi:hypothetical protein